MTKEEMRAYTVGHIEQVVGTLLCECERWWDIKLGSEAAQKEFRAYQHALRCETEEQRDRLLLKEKRRLALEIIRGAREDAPYIDMKMTPESIRVTINPFTLFGIEIEL